MKKNLFVAAITLLISSLIIWSLFAKTAEELAAVAIFLFAFAGMIFVANMIATIFFGSSKKKMRKENDELHESLRQANACKEDLQKSCDRLSKRNEDLQKANGALCQEVEDLKKSDTEKEELQRANDELCKKEKDLEKKRSELHKKNSQLEGVNAYLLKSNENLSKSNDELNQKNSELLEEKAEISNDLSRLHKRNWEHMFSFLRQISGAIGHSCHGRRDFGFLAAVLAQYYDGLTKLLTCPDR